MYSFQPSYDLYSFLRDLNDIRKETFTYSTITSAWKKSGLWPVDKTRVLDRIKQWQHPSEYWNSKGPANQLQLIQHELEQSNPLVSAQLHLELRTQLKLENYIPLDSDLEPGLPPLIPNPETPARTRPETPETLEETVRSIQYVEERVTQLLSSPSRTLFQKTNIRTLAHFETQRILTNQVQTIH